MQHPKRNVYAKRVELYALSSKRTARRDRLAIPTQDRIVVIQVEDILYLKADNNYTHIYGVAGRHLVVSRTLKAFERNLNNNTFLRVHQTYIINTKYLQEYISSAGLIKLSNSITIPVSRARKYQVVQFLKTLIISSQS